MARRHLLDAYGCTGDRYCVGCFNDYSPAEETSEPTEPDRPSRSAPRASEMPPPARPATARPPSEPEGPAPTPPVVVLRAQWTPDGTPTDRARSGEILTLRATVHEAPPGAVARFLVQHRGTGEEQTLEAGVDGDRAAVDYAPPGAGDYRFDVSVGSARATSDDLVVEADRLPLKLCHIGQVLRTLREESRVVARWYLEDLSYQFLCTLAEAGASDPENHPGHMPRELCLLPGMEGEDVREAQRALPAFGHALEETGVFDGATKAALLAWLPSVQPDRAAVAPATRARVAQSHGFSSLCSDAGIADWTDLWDDLGPGLEEDASLPGSRTFQVPGRSERARGRELLEETGRDTTLAYGGLAYVPPVETIAHAPADAAGRPVELRSAMRVELDGAGPAVEADAPRRWRAPRGSETRLRVRETVRRFDLE